MQTLDGHFELDWLTYQPQPYFTLPYAQLHDGTIRFTDRGYLGRQYHRMLAFNAWALSFGSFAFSATLAVYLGPPGWTEVVMIVVGLAAAAVAWRLHSGPRTRFIDVNADGGVSITDHSRRTPNLEPPAPRRSEIRLCRIRARVYRFEWDPFAVLVSDGTSWAALSFGRTQEQCLEALAGLPPEAAALLAVEPRPDVSASLLWP
jgi:hypothetical protein